MSDRGVKDRFEEPVRSTARGVDPATPARALSGVIIVVGVVVAILVVALLIIWSVAK